MDITVRAQITGRNLILVPPANVTMAGTLNGVTGGQATGTRFGILNQQHGRLYVTIDFFDNGSAEATQGDTSLVMRFMITRDTPLDSQPTAM